MTLVVESDQSYLHIIVPKEKPSETVSVLNASVSSQTAMTLKEEPEPEWTKRLTTEIQDIAKNQSY